MKRTIKVIIYFLIFTVLLTTNVKAEDEACKITLSADKTTLKPGEEVVITLLMSNVTKETGILQFLSILDFSEDAFEVIFDEDEELSANLEGTDYESFEILYSGAQDTDATIKNPWYVLYLESGGTKGIYGSTGADPQIEDQVVGRIKLKVKEDVKLTNATIFVADTEVFDVESYTSTGEIVGYEIADAEIELQIDVPLEDENLSAGNNTQNNVAQNGSVAQNTVVNNSNTNTSKQNNIVDNSNTTKQNSAVNNNMNKSTNNQTQVENKAKQEVPYTGIEDYIPFVFIGMIISVIAYINYRKYKDI